MNLLYSEKVGLSKALGLLQAAAEDEKFRDLVDGKVALATKDAEGEYVISVFPWCTTTTFFVWTKEEFVEDQQRIEEEQRKAREYYKKTGKIL